MAAHSADAREELFLLVYLRGRSLSTYAVGERGGVMKMQTEVYRGEGGSVKCVHTQCIRMLVFTVKQHTALPFEYLSI